MLTFTRYFSLLFAHLNFVFYWISTSSGVRDNFLIFSFLKALLKVASKPRLFPGEESPGIHCLRMRVIITRVLPNIASHDIAGGRGL